MSEILVNTIKKADGTGGLTVPSGSGTVATLAGGTFTGAIAMGANNISFSNGNGIDFSASEGSGADSSILDDYEEGTFTLSVTDGTTSKTATANYTKVGSLVYFRGGISNIEQGGAFSGAVYLTGLPFSSAGASNVSSFINYTNTATSWAARISNDTNIRFFKFGVASSDYTELSGNDVGTYTDMLVAGCYATV